MRCALLGMVISLSGIWISHSFNFLPVHSFRLSNGNGCHVRCGDAEFGKSFKSRTRRNGHTLSTMSSQPPSRPFSPAILHNGTRTSTDSEPTTNASPLNGMTHHDDTDQDQDPDMDPLERLQRQLARERAEKEDLATQYRNLLAKLTTMRTTLGNKLKQDAVRCLASITRTLTHSFLRKNSIVGNSTSRR